MVRQAHHGTVLGFLAGLMATIFGTRTAKPTTKDLKDADFTTSTQRLGVRFTERVRNIFRFKWFKKV